MRIMYFLGIFKAEKITKKTIYFKMAVSSVWTEIALVSSTCAKESAIWGNDNLLTD